MSHLGFGGMIAPPLIRSEGRRDARLAFEEEVEIVLELQEASRLMREAARDSSR
jgi:hypothetical protein